MQKKFFLLAYFFICAHCFAQQYPFVHYTPKDGLVNSRVRKAFQDSKGRMYFLTYGGLSVYDGSSFKNYTVQNGLATELVNDILETGNDSFWIAPNTNKLNYLRQGKIQTFKTADGFCPTINKFIKTKDGAVYVAADEGLFLFEKNRFIRLPFINKQGLDAGKFLINAIEWNGLLLVLSDRALDAAATSNLYIFSKTERKITGENENRFISSYGITDKGEIYVADNSGTLQLLDTVALSNQGINYLPPPDQFKNVTPGISYMYFDYKKNFWFYSAYKKIVRIDSSGATKEFSTANGLNSNHVTEIFMDKEGSLWFTLDGPGVDKLVNDNIELYEEINGAAISNLYTDETTDSVYLYTSPGKKILIVNREKITEYKSSSGEIMANAMTVSGGKIYLSDGKKMFVFTRDNVQQILLPKDTAELGFGNIFIDPYKNLLLCGPSYISVLSGGMPVSSYPIDNYSDQLCFDKKNRLWTATRGGDLFVFKINPGNGANYLETLKKYDKPYPALSARSLTIDHSGNVWIGTRHEGLYYFRINEDLTIHSFQQYTVKDGLSDNFITHLTCDKENNIWASTSSGVDKISHSRNTVRIGNMTRSNNIYEQILKTFISKDGVAWSYTSDGNLVRIGKSSQQMLFIPSLLITGLKIGNMTGDSLFNAASFSYRQNNLSISVAAPSFYDERQVKYSYLLQGSGNDQWSDPSNTSTFNFINLTHGKYTLKIKASFPGNRYPDQTIDYPFVIHPPWWQTVLFRLIAACSIMGLLIIGFRVYYNNKLRRQKAVLEKQQAIEKERTRIATDIHDDLGSGLSRIRYLGEMVKLKSSQQQNILPDIDKISVFSDEMVDKMNEIVWALNEKNDSLEAIISYIRSFAAEYLSNNDLACSVNLPEEIPHHIIKGETRRNIFLSVKECLHNIVKHAEANETNITVSVGDHLVIRISDNGKGIDWEKMRPFSNGIMNIKKRMKDAGGAVDFKNENGTIVTLSIPL